MGAGSRPDHLSVSQNKRSGKGLQVTAPTVFAEYDMPTVNVRLLQQTRIDVAPMTFTAVARESVSAQADNHVDISTACIPRAQLPQYVNIYSAILVKTQTRQECYKATSTRIKSSQTQNDQERILIDREVTGYLSLALYRSRVFARKGEEKTHLYVYCCSPFMS